ncbi:MAG: hypothetical protein D6820_16895 [Lentisphaerae bacterium]|nr:MAG: hypothetical protein D6820_16895 [Lentisphaerota bacterium]
MMGNSVEQKIIVSLGQHDVSMCRLKFSTVPLLGKKVDEGVIAELVFLCHSSCEKGVGFRFEARVREGLLKEGASSRELFVY